MNLQNYQRYSTVDKKKARINRPLAHTGAHGPWLLWRLPLKVWQTDIAECWFCGHNTDDAFHTFFQCDARETRRRVVEIYIGGTLDPGTMMEYMLKDRHLWNIISNYVHEVLIKNWRRKKKECYITLVKLKPVGRRPNAGGLEPPTYVKTYIYVYIYYNVRCLFK